MRNHLPCELCSKQLLPLAGIRHKCFQNSSSKTALLTAMVAWHKHKKTWANLVDRIIVLTPFAKQKFISSSLGIPESKFLVKANSVDDYEVLAFNKRANYVVFVGRLSPEKGIDVLVEAAKHTAITIKIVGDGPLQDLVMSSSKAYKNIEYIGQQSHNQVIKLIQHSRGLMLPSVCYEGLPNTILEAFSTGTPVLVSDIDNLNQIVSNQQNGFTFNTGNSFDLAKKINQLIHSNQWKALAAQARQNYETHYTHEMNYQNLIRLYQELIVT